jgi:hypothetical protein
MQDVANGSAISERQTRAHRRFHYNAVIEFGDASKRRSCIIWGISRAGARLSAETVVDLPDTFSLVLAQNGSVRRLCQVQWRFDNHLIVQFMARETQPALSKNIVFVD